MSVIEGLKKSGAGNVPVDENNQPIKEHFSEVLENDGPDHERFKAWIESVFGTQRKYAEKVGYSVKQICEYCSGKQPMPKCLLFGMEISLYSSKRSQQYAQKLREKDKEIRHLQACLNQGN